MRTVASLFVLAVILFLAGSWCVWSIHRHAPLLEPELSPLDTLDGLMGDPCDARRPHRMLPTSFGWRCANNCGEAWFVDPADDLATADLALWELEWEQA